LITPLDTPTRLWHHLASGAPGLAALLIYLWHKFNGRTMRELLKGEDTVDGKQLLLRLLEINSRLTHLEVELETLKRGKHGDVQSGQSPEDT
jgi:hypothetical protein